MQIPIFTVQSHPLCIETPDRPLKRLICLTYVILAAATSDGGSRAVPPAPPSWDKCEVIPGTIRDYSGTSSRQSGLSGVSIGFAMGWWEWQTSPKPSQLNFGDIFRSREVQILANQTKIIRIARFWAHFDLIVAISARTWCFGDFILQAPLPMSTFTSLNLPSTLLFDPITPLAYSASPS